MSFFNKVFASFGIGAATVDTKLEKSSYQAGETAKGVVEIKGGSTSQTIDSIYLTLYTTYIRESDDKKYTDYAPIQKVQISEPFTIGENEKREIPFSFTLPFETPITYGNTRVWVATGLDIKNSVDPKDKDYIEIVPHNLINGILQSVQDLGFRIRKVECEQAPRRFRGRYPFIQEFEFVPVSGAYQRSLDEIELMFLNQSEEQADVLIEVDRRARGLGGFLAEALEMDESMVKMTIRSSDLPHLSSKLKETIDKFI
ncbi:sporulation protein SpoOM [[Bacillus] enclensis]|jgi:sporulation-control protein|uniref:Sporulation-control protein n=2 Tax=Rossellomorea TaxID=2837508 RepID=A0A0V8HLD6_9BACI|nr:sporulation protein [[Bacillus] enclensis]OAT83922.1 sporulation protein SpoOM [Bacillus sp. MKU004]QTC43217.1 sporulation protein [Bacillus sp. V3]KSU63365.1 sporulation protein SpoOM [[Bacillus] enclensis]MBH9968688.1 sporulation protein [[Bacillus] enclensis]SCB82657.1 sporulation-control protein [[Bacillus] enclensis]